MEAGEVLANTLSPNQQIRDDAVQKLEKAAREHWNEYLGMLSRELANEQGQPHVRTAAGLALKNALTAKETIRRQEYQAKWQVMNQGVRAEIKNSDTRAGQSAAQFIAAIAAIELPKYEWPELMRQLVANVSEEQTASLKQSSLQAIGYICESVDPKVLATESNQILTAVVQGARKEESNAAVRVAAINALFDSLDFVKENFDREGERNYIMQVICEATQSDEVRIQVAAFGCLVRIMQLYYEKMQFYMEKALYGLTIMGMNSPIDEVVLQAVEFWSTVCEVEIEITFENQDALMMNEEADRQIFRFAKVAMPEILPVLLNLLTRQDDDIEDDEWNVAMAAGTCLQLFAQCVEGHIVGPVLTFVEQNIRESNWKQREAAVMAFGSILEGPEPSMLESLVQQALPILINMMDDPIIQVKDTTAWALGRISDLVVSAISTEAHLPGLMHALFKGFNDHPRIISNCSWALMNLAEQLGDESQESATAPMSAYYDGCVPALVRVTERPDNDFNARTSAYEALSSLATHAAVDKLPVISELLTITLDRLMQSVDVQKQLVGIEERTSHEELQSNLCSLLTSIIRKLNKNIRPSADRIMTTLLQLLQNAYAHSTIQEDIFLAVGALTTALEEYFGAYLDSFAPYLYSALANHEEYQLCSIAIGLIGDISRALGENVFPYCDNFMTHLLNDIQSGVLDSSVKPAILSCFGDIALAIGARFENYLTFVMQVLQQASGVRIDPTTSFDMIDYVNSLREGIVEAYVGITQAMKSGGRAQLLIPYVQHIFGFLSVVHNEVDKTEPLTRGIIGLLGDLAEAFPNREIKQYFAANWVNECIKQGRGKTGYSQATREVARWAREQVSRQQA